MICHKALRHGLFALLAGTVLLACAPGPSAAAKKRVATLAADPIGTLNPPGSEPVLESRVAGHKTQAPYGQGRPTVHRHYTFTGDARQAARSVLEQGRAAGWSLEADCDLQKDDTFWVRGSKRLTDATGTYRAAFEAQIYTRPASPGGSGGGPVVLVEISARYPGEELKGTLAPSAPTSAPPAPAKCLDL